MSRIVLLPAEGVVPPRAVDGAAVPTTLSVWAASSQCHRHVQLSIVELQEAPHRRLSRSLVEIVVPRAQVERTARRIVSVLHHLHHSLESGTALRLRKSGTFTAVWNVDVLRSGALLTSWPVSQKSIETLDRLDLETQKHLQAPGRSPQMAALSEHLDEIARDLTRERRVEDVIRQNVEMPIEELLRVLEARDLLVP